MRSDDIKFFLNERRVGATVIVGAQPDFSFFDQLAPHLNGHRTIRFRVGEQTIENQVALNGTEYRVQNNFVPFDIDTYVADAKKCVRSEQERANFTDELTDVYFIPARTLLAWQPPMPAFDPKLLVKDPDGLTYFVSHPWLATQHPDPDGKHLALIQEHARRQNEDTFYWIDYSCLPQRPRNAQDEAFFRQTLPKISTIQSKGSTLAIVEGDYSRRMWCYMEHFAAVLFSFRDYTGVASRIDYAGDSSSYSTMLDKVQTLEEPPWEDLKVTDRSDIPGIKYNYRFMSTLAKFQLYDRFTELRRSLPGHDIYSGLHYPQCAFGLDHTASLCKLRSLFFEFGGDMQFFYKEQSLLWLARRFSWSIFPDDYKIEDFQFPQHLCYSEVMVGWLALLLAIITFVNQANDKIVNLREEYAKIVLMSLYS